MNENAHNDEIIAIALLKAIYRYRYFLLLLQIIAIASAFWVISTTPKLWEASAIFQIGQIGQAGQPGESGMLVEPIANVMSRMTHPSFPERVVKKLDISPTEKSFAMADLSSLKITQVKNSNLIEIRVKGESSKFAADLLKAVLYQLQETHQAIIGPTILRFKEELRNVTDAITANKDEVDIVKKQLLAKPRWNSYDMTLALIIIKNKDNELKELSQRKATLEEMLSPMRTFSTKLVGDIYVSAGSVSPNRSLIFSLAVSIGLMLGLLAAFVHRAIWKI